MTGAAATGSGELFAASNGLELCYETFGSAEDPTVLLVMGLTAQMIAWDARFCSGLAGRGFHVVRFDNRDVGKSTKLDDHTVDTPALIAAQLTGSPLPEVPYKLADMAADGIGLLDALGVERAHIVGASMGGMIVQEMAIGYPERVRSLTSMWSTTGNPQYMESSDEALMVLMAPAPEKRDDYIAASKDWAVWSSRRHFDLVDAERRAAEAFDRSFSPAGGDRQFGAIAASPDREPELADLAVPTLVIHGRDDTLIKPSGGFRTAEVIPGADLLLVGDMGHDLPVELHELVADAIAGHARRAG